MKTSAVAFLLGLYALPALAQELAPSPTESIGCEPHGDHWHCEGPRPPATTEPTTPTPPAVITTTSAAAGGDDEHTDEAGTASLAPSPTESIGCEPHGDHWHCEGPRPPATETATGGEGAETTSAPPVVESSASSLITVTTTTAAESSGEATPSATSSAVVTGGVAGAPGFAAMPVLGLAALAAFGL
ncbi:hypothetical protein B0I37DRAFT_413532 [Chaetomium sp. MPI-CAGE-AT-0009]|nr:hypothetical protein B0I37DRAFT_413532 [Chaetomium sp. MPI-CAGE-AT-0009]